MDADQHKQVMDAIRTAGQMALQLRDAGALNIRHKTEDSWSCVTDADLAVSEFVTMRLNSLFNGLTVISEEDPDLPADGFYKTAAVMDPIDGTSTFAKGKSDFSVLLGFVENHVPTHGFAYFPDPRIDAFYYTGVGGKGAFRKARDGQVTQLHAPFSDRAAPRMNKYGPLYEDVLPVQDLTSDYGFSSGIAILEDRLDFASGPESMCDWDILAFDALVRQGGGGYANVATRDLMRYGERREAPGSYWAPRYLGGHLKTLKKHGILAF